MRHLVVPLLATLALAGCGDATRAPAAAGDQPEEVSSPTAVPAAAGRVQTSYAVTVLDAGSGAELCVGGVLESLPPQCGGPPITNWDWADHEGSFEDVSGTRWGEFHVLGTFDGEQFTTTEVTPGDDYQPPERPDDDLDLATPCPDPGGWSGDDPARVSPAALDEAGRIARRLDHYGTSWVDRARDLRTVEEVDQDALEGGEDVSTWIFNVAVTDDLAGAEAALRRAWGGGLCVSEADHAEAELMEIRQELEDLPGLTSMGSFRTVDVSVVHDDGSIQAWVDQEYGEGVVRVSSALVPAG